MEAVQDSSEHDVSTEELPLFPLEADVDTFGIAPWKGNDDSAICFSSKQFVLTPPMPQESQAYSCDTDFELSIAPDDKQTTGAALDAFYSGEPCLEGFLPYPGTMIGEEDELNLADGSTYEINEAPTWTY